MILCTICMMEHSSQETFLQHFQENHINYESEDKKTIQLNQIMGDLKKNFTGFSISRKTTFDGSCLFVLQNDETEIEQLFDGNTFFKSPKNSKELIDELSEKLLIIQTIKEEVMNSNAFEYIACKGYSYGYSEDEHCFSFSFLLKRESRPRTINFYPYEYNQITDFIRTFQQFYATELKGVPSLIYKGGYFEGYAIDGVPIDEILKRAKRVQIEILEK